MQFGCNNFFISIFENEFLAMGILDSNRNIFKVNSRFLKMTGYSEEELIGKHYSELTYLDDLDHSEMNHLQLSELRHLNYEKRLIKKNGDNLWAKVTLSRVDENGEIYYVSIIEDITKLKLDSEIASLKNDQLEIILNNALLAIVSVDEELNIKYTNQKFLEMLGYNLSDVENMNLKDIYHPDEVSDMSRKLNKNNFKKDYQILRRYRHKLGHYLHVNINVSVLPTNKYNFYALAIFEDVTKQVENENLIEQQKLMLVNASKMAALGEMAAGIAHEINNPLTIIAGNVLRIKRTFLRDEAQINVNECLKDLEKIETTTHRISKIVSGLRIFSNGKVQTELENCNLVDIINSTLELCGEKFKYSHIDCVFQNQEPLFVSTLQIQLSQVILNLLNNAHDAIELLADKWVKIIIESENDIVKIKIIDSGKGIPGEILDKIMNPFFTTKEVGKGTGIGLSIAQKIIHDLGGRLYYELYQQSNTSFVIELNKLAPTLS